MCRAPVSCVFLRICHVSTCRVHFNIAVFVQHRIYLYIKEMDNLDPTFSFTILQQFMLSFDLMYFLAKNGAKYSVSSFLKNISNFTNQIEEGGKEHLAAWLEGRFSKLPEPSVPNQPACAPVKLIEKENYRPRYHRTNKDIYKG